MRIRDLAAARVRYGYRRVHVLLAREGWKVNHKRVFRLYRLEGLSLRLKVRKKRVSAPRLVQPAPTAPNQRWSMDFMSDSLHDGRRFRVFTLVDNMTRESPHIAVERSFSGQQIAEILDQVGQRIGLPEAIQLDNGPEFTSKALDEWAARNKVKLLFSRPGTPTDNPYVEAFNGRLRAECLDQHWFTSLEDAKSTIESWRKEYNTERPHTALGNLAPAEYRASLGKDSLLSETG
jgi:putative transposase